MPETSIENAIRETLSADAQNNALAFVAHLRTHDAQFERGAGYWSDKRYWMVKHSGEYLCFMLINGSGGLMHKDEPEGWIIWSDDTGKVEWFANYPLDEHTKAIAWANVDYCGHCGGRCDGGFHKTIFGKEFDNVCNTTFRFDNPDAEAVECAKRLIEIRINSAISVEQTG
ncbi:hypothetical protein AGMMS49992_12540 [Clostridia bacterium]|nr:hypothetical protein AGMMS49992_12540 [Clostridia bacterium]